MPTRAAIIPARRYLDWLRTQPCIITGQWGSDYDAVDPAHIGTAGKGIKNDAEALPVLHSIHRTMHARGEMRVWHELIPDWLLREALRAYARQMHREWSDG